MQSSSPYTLQPIKTKKRWIGSTVFLSIAAIVGGIGVDMAMNGGVSSLLPAPSSSSSNTPATGPVTATGDAVQYQYGTVQLSVTRDSGKITKVDLVQAGATAGREQAFPYLQQYAIDSNGSSFGNLSGATYTTDAFKQALDSAISKLG
ncbi:MAG: hypothetical protein RLZ71_606 [Actinomycetota bacterium]